MRQDFVADVLEMYLRKMALLEKLKGLNPYKIEKINDIQSKIAYVESEAQKNGIDTDTMKAQILSKISKTVDYSNVVVRADGAARGNNDPSKPNRSAIGFAVYLDGNLTHEEARYLGGDAIIPSVNEQDGVTVVEATNNTSEYLAIIAALEYLIENEYTMKKVTLYSDSSVVVQQINLTNAARAKHLIQLRNVARKLIEEFSDISIVHVLRQENYYVDKMINELLDSHERRAEDERTDSSTAI